MHCWRGGSQAKKNMGCFFNDLFFMPACLVEIMPFKRVIMMILIKSIKSLLE